MTYVCNLQIYLYMSHAKWLKSNMVVYIILSTSYILKNFFKKYTQKRTEKKKFSSRSIKSLASIELLIYEKLIHDNYKGTTNHENVDLHITRSHSASGVAWAKMLSEFFFFYEGRCFQSLKRKL